ncbi:unnamed protein product, partial [marine sediment metagenome]
MLFKKSKILLKSLLVIKDFNSCFFSEVSQNKGNFEIEVIDANQYKNNQYVKLNIKVNEKLKRIIESNILYIRTVDTGSYNGRAGLGQVNEDFDVCAI